MITAEDRQHETLGRVTGIYSSVQKVFHSLYSRYSELLYVCRHMLHIHTHGDVHMMIRRVDGIVDSICLPAESGTACVCTTCGTPTLYSSSNVYHFV